MREDEVAATCVEVDGEVLRWSTDSDGTMPHGVALVDESISRHVPLCKVTTRQRVGLAGVVLVCCEATLVFTA